MQKITIGKTALTTTLALLLASGNVYAAQEQTEAVIGSAYSTEDIQQDTMPEGLGDASKVATPLTYEDAVLLARKNSAEMRNYEDQAEYLQKLKEDIWDITGDFNVPSVSYQQWVDPSIYQIYSSIQQISSNMSKNEYGEEITKLTLEATVKNYFTSIFSDESSLDLAQADVALKKKLYEQGVRKNELGVLSDYNLQQLKDDWQNAQFNVDKLELALQQEYNSFYNFIGTEPEKRYTLIYNLEYTPYELPEDLDKYVDTKLNADYTIKLQELAVEDAEFGKNYLAQGTTSSQNATNEYNFQQAQRSLKTAKQNKELAIKNAYQSIIQLESQHDSAVAALQQAEAAKQVAAVNYQVGNSTAITVEQANLAVEQAKNAIVQLEYAHDMQIYQLENTELLSGSTGATGGM